MANEQTQKSLTAAMAAVRRELHVAKKNVNQHLRSSYRTTSDILMEVKPLLAKEGLTLYLLDEIEEVAGWHYVKSRAIVQTIDGKETMEVTGFAREDENRAGISQSQCTGAASTYARKYALQGLFLIDDSALDPDDPKMGSKSYEARTEAELLALIAGATSVSELVAIHKANSAFCPQGSRALQALTTRKNQLTQK